MTFNAVDLENEALYLYHELLRGYSTLHLACIYKTTLIKVLGYFLFCFFYQRLILTQQFD